MPGIYTIQEYESFDGSKLHQADFEELKGFANTSPVLQRTASGGVAAANYVGTVTTKRETVVEILPKMDLAGKTGSDYETTPTLVLAHACDAGVGSRKFQRYRRATFAPCGASPCSKSSSTSFSPI